MAKDTYETPTWRKHGQPAIKTEENRSGSKRTSKHVMDAAREAKSSARWDDKGRPTHGANVPGYNKGTGTPGYVKSAAQAAEKLTKLGALDCGYGKQEVHKSHRQNGWTEGKPENKKDAGYRNPMKETP